MQRACSSSTSQIFSTVAFNRLTARRGRPWEQFRGAWMCHGNGPQMDEFWWIKLWPHVHFFLWREGWHTGEGARIEKKHSEQIKVVGKVTDWGRGSCTRYFVSHRCPMAVTSGASGGGALATSGRDGGVPPLCTPSYLFPPFSCPWAPYWPWPGARKEDVLVPKYATRGTSVAQVLRYRSNFSCSALHGEWIFAEMSTAILLLHDQSKQKS